ncbi:oxidoreductase [Kineosporia sp. NBRC 101731]|nr:oxidoreductase [Kineosporia sp. NBRC 101731]
MQETAGEGGPGWGSPMFGPEIPAGFAAFLQAQQMLTIGAMLDDGRVWASHLSGPPGFARAVDQETIVIDALPVDGDPLREAFETERELGLLALHPQTRRRIRINGRARRDGSKLVLHTEQVLGNCPKYLQTRGIVETRLPADTSARHGTELSEKQRLWVERADTFFIASYSEGNGADASHRGGTPGFVTASARRLRWPDYTGNQFYMTLGNLYLNPAAGLLFVDWDRGHTLQMSGTARVDWDPDQAAVWPGALRVVEFDVESVVQIDRASRLQWEFLGYSRFNPPVQRNRRDQRNVNDDNASFDE